MCSTMQPFASATEFGTIGVPLTTIVMTAPGLKLHWLTSNDVPSARSPRSSVANVGCGTVVVGLPG